MRVRAFSPSLRARGTKTRETPLQQPLHAIPAGSPLLQYGGFSVRIPEDINGGRRGRSGSISAYALSPVPQQGAVISCGLGISDRADVGFDQTSCRQSERHCGANTDGRIRGSLRRFARRSQINIAELLVVARSQEESIVSRFEADVLSVIADTLTQAGTAARWERHGIGAQELAMHLLDTSAGVKSATGNLSDY